MSPLIFWPLLSHSSRILHTIEEAIRSEEFSFLSFLLAFLRPELLFIVSGLFGLSPFRVGILLWRLRRRVKAIRSRGSLSVPLIVLVVLSACLYLVSPILGRRGAS